MRRFDEAIDAYERAIALSAEVSDRYGQASAYTGLGLVYAELDRPERARRAWAE